ncbi:corrinoid protein [Palleronia sp. KMU-117]|jgi:5-methyltetrahydrofolate--homocysteine methyltransferase|uniref:corrinoid protein n=1 Tax=Palleronia sp. KMU-117 TaxID=3434108 RepID=UPI003D747AF9
MALNRELYDAIIDGKAAEARTLVEAEIGAGADPMALIAESMIPAMDEVGELFQEERYFVPELMMAGRAMKAAMEPLRPLMARSNVQPLGTVVVGAVKGDLHDIGKNLVGTMLEGSGFRVIDLGTDVPPAKFVAAILEHRPQILCLSALLTVTMVNMRATVAAIEAAGLRDQVRILVGGAPLNERFAREIGADGYGATSTEAVSLARRLVEAA